MKIYTKKEEELLNQYLEERLEDVKNQEYRDFIIMYFNLLKNQKLSYYPLPQDKEEIEAEANKDFNELKKRIEKIEKKFPKDTELNKIASINDEIFATRIKELSEAVKRIEENQLTKWDVAIILFKILGALGALIAIGAVILKYIVI